MTKGRAPRPIEERFWGKVNFDGPVPEYRPDLGPCWLWTRALNNKGYGSFYVGARRTDKAHRVAYRLLIGPIPDGLQPDHLCRVRACVNPWHFEPVTALENTLRGVSHQAAKTHCPVGHPYDSANTLRSAGRRYCLACRRPLDRARQQARRDAAKAAR